MFSFSQLRTSPSIRVAHHCANESPRTENRYDDDDDDDDNGDVDDDDDDQHDCDAGDDDVDGDSAVAEKSYTQVYTILRKTNTANLPASPKVYLWHLLYLFGTRDPESAQQSKASRP